PCQRIVVMLAGSAFNILFAVLVLWGMLWVNGVTEVRPVVGDVTAGSVAAAAGLRSGDEIRTINDVAVSGQRDVVFGLLDAMSSRGEAALSVRGRGGELRSAKLAVPDAEQRRRLTEPAELFRGLGFQFWTPPLPAVLGQVMPDGPAARAGLLAGDDIVAIDGQAVHDFREIVALISAHPGERVTIDYRRGGSAHRVPLPMAVFAGVCAEAGVAAFMGFLVLISLSLGFLNLLPIPILDGGQIVFQLVEWLKGSPLSERAQALGQQVGIALLIVLMGVA